jgi:predicted RND superfamily exporter protein
MVSHFKPTGLFGLLMVVTMLHALKRAEKRLSLIDTD